MTKRPHARRGTPTRGRRGEAPVAAQNAGEAVTFVLNVTVNAKNNERVTLEDDQDLRRLEALRREVLETIRSRDIEVSPRLPDAVDDAQRAAQAELQVQLANEQTRKLHEINDAIKALHQGIYGTCQICEQKIAAKRLAAIPMAKFCISCQEKVDAGMNEVPEEDSDLELVEAD